MQNFCATAMPWNQADCFDFCGEAVGSVACFVVTVQRLQCSLIICPHWQCVKFKHGLLGECIFVFVSACGMRLGDMSKWRKLLLQGLMHMCVEFAWYVVCKCALVWLRSRADALNKSDGFLFPAVLGLQLFESWNGPVQRDCRGST